MDFSFRGGKEANTEGKGWRREERKVMFGMLEKALKLLEIWLSI